MPKLMKLIAAELDLERQCRDGLAERVYYELTEMCSVELERFNAKKAREEVTLQKYVKSKMSLEHRHANFVFLAN